MEKYGGTGAGDIYPLGVFSCLGQQTTRIKGSRVCRRCILARIMLTSVRQALTHHYFPSKTFDEDEFKTPQVSVVTKRPGRLGRAGGPGPVELSEVPLSEAASSLRSAPRRET